VRANRRAISFFAQLGLSGNSQPTDQQSGEGQTMRRIARWTATWAAGVLLMWIAMAAQPAVAQSDVPRDALLQFEENVKWKAVSREWVDQRDGWIKAVQSAASPADLAAQLVALESAMRWRSVEDSWRERRDSWVGEMQAAQTSGVVSGGLLELERATKWSAVEPAWRNMRDGWIARLEAAR
jgi:hypothetical protein